MGFLYCWLNKELFRLAVFGEMLDSLFLSLHLSGFQILQQ